jgi:hypothetical protein
MSDQAPVLPLFVHSYSPLAPLQEIGAMLSNGTVNCATVTYTANLSIFIPVYLPWAYPVNRVFWVNGSVVTTTNNNFGIFRKNGRRIYSTGSTAQSGASLPQFVTPATPFVLPAGAYYFAFSCDGTTNRYSGVGAGIELLKMCGVLQQASNFALADPSAPTTATVAAYPYCGITRTVSGF